MELSRRGMLAGLGVAGGVGAVGFVGAATVTDDGSLGDGADDGSPGDGADADDEANEATPVDPDAPFEALLVDSGDEEESESADASDDPDAPFLFDAADLEHVQTLGEDADSDDHLVYVSLSADGREVFGERLEAAGATDDPESFAVSMVLDGEEVRRVDLDEPTVAALTDEEWNGVLELAFESASVSADVYESLAAE